MNFEKKLIILSGGGAKGTVAVEHSAYGTYATVNIYNVPDLKYGEYCMGIKTADGQAFTRVLGGLGRIMARYKMPDFPLSALHCVLFEESTNRVVMYGTASTQKLWESNLMDGIRSKTIETSPIEQPQAPTQAEPSLPNYSGRPKEIENFFLDIMPKGEKYIDDAVAQVNYYAGEANAETEAPETVAKPSLKKPTAQVNYAEFNARNESAEKRTFDAVGKEKSRQAVVPPHSDGKQNLDDVRAEAASTVSCSQELPSNMEMRYLYRHRGFRYAAPAEVLCDSAESDLNTGEALQKQQAVKAEPKAEPQQPSKPEKPTLTEKTLPPQSFVETKENGAKPDGTVKAGKILSAGQDEVISVVPASQFSARAAIENNKTSSTFYEQVKKQVDDLFAVNKRFEILEKLLPDTKFVRVDYDDGGKYYVVGLIGSRPDYLCYGAPGKYSPTPPAELDGYCQWLPLSPQEPEGAGFWLMYQDAISGESVEK